MGQEPPQPSPVPTTACVNLPLDPPWTGGGQWDCDFYENTYGREWCRHDHINSQCCYCQTPETSPVPSPQNEPTVTSTSVTMEAVCNFRVVFCGYTSAPPGEDNETLPPPENWTIENDNSSFMVFTDGYCGNCCDINTGLCNS